MFGHWHDDCATAVPFWAAVQLNPAQCCDIGLGFELDRGLSFGLDGGIACRLDPGLDCEVGSCC